MSVRCVHYAEGCLWTGIVSLLEVLCVHIHEMQWKWTLTVYIDIIAGSPWELQICVPALSIM